MCRTNTPSQQGGNSYNHDSSCFGHRVELNTEAREEGGELYCLCYYDKMGILHVLLWQLLLWSQGGAEHWGKREGRRAVLSALSWQDGNTYMWGVSTSHRWEGCACPGQDLACGGQLVCPSVCLFHPGISLSRLCVCCLLYTSDAADES